MENLALIDENTAGELEIENFLVREIEIRRKDLLPVFDHFQRSRFDGSGRCIIFYILFTELDFSFTTSCTYYQMLPFALPVY